MASYQQHYDAQSYQVSPYQLPIQQITQAIATRTAFWDQGASQVKQAYENYLGLDLSLEKNRGKLDSLMEGVNQNLKKVSSMDLSIASNVGDAMKVFDPIAHDEDIKYDNAFTKFQKQQNKIAEGFKNIDKGEGYSQTNVAYMSDPYNKWVASNDPTKTKEAFGNRRAYTPYHDPMKEIRELEKGFKPNSISFNGPEVDKNGKPIGYMKLQEDKSIYASQYRAYMDAHMSDKAKQQLHINGVVAYGDNHDRLAKDFIRYNSGIINGESGKIIGLKHEIEVLKGKKDGTNDPALQEEYSDQIKQYEGDIKDRTGTITKLEAKDYSDLNKNKEAWAGQIYTNDWTDNLSKASQRIDKKTSYSSDNTAMIYFKEKMDMSKFNTQLQFNHDENAADRQNKLDVANINHRDGGNGRNSKGEKLDKDENVIIEKKGVIEGAHAEDNESFGPAQLKNMEDHGNNLKYEATKTLISNLENLGVVDKKATLVQKQAAVDQWRKENSDPKAPGNKYLNEFLQKYSEADSELNLVRKLNKKADQEVEKTIMNDPDIKTGKTVQVIDPSTGKTVDLNLSREDLIILKNGGNDSTKQGTDILNLKNGLANTESYLQYKGKRYLTPEKSVFGKLMVGADILKTFVGMGKQSDITTMKNKILTREWTKLEGREDYVNPDQESLKGIKSQIFGKIGVAGIKEDNVHLVGQYKNGDVIVRVVPENALGVENVDQISTSVKAIGGKGTKNKDGTITLRIPASQVGDAVKPKFYNDPILSNIQKEVDIESAGAPSGKVFNTINYRINNKNFNFRVNIESGIPRYEVVHEESGAVFSPKDGYYPSLEAAALDAKKMSQETDEDFILAIRTVGGKPKYKNK